MQQTLFNVLFNISYFVGIRSIFNEYPGLLNVECIIHINVNATNINKEFDIKNTVGLVQMHHGVESSKYTMYTSQNF